MQPEMFNWLRPAGMAESDVDGAGASGLRQPLHPPPFAAGSPTSIAAAAAIESRAETLRVKLLLALREAGECGLTDQEMQRALNMDPSTQRPRRGELVKDGKVIDSGLRRRTASGRQAVVWRVA